MSLQVDPQYQFVRWQGASLRSVSARTFLIDTQMEQDDHEAVAALLQTVRHQNLTARLNKAYGALENVPERKLEDWKRAYVNRALEPLGLIYRSDAPVDVFANLEVGFHTDAFAVSDCVFCVAVVAGPPRDLFFPQTGDRYTLSPGKVALFDPSLVHALLNVGDTAFGVEAPTQVAVDDITVFLSAELYLREEVRDKFGIRILEPGTPLPPQAHRPDMEDCSMATGLYRSHTEKFDKSEIAVTSN